MRKITRKNFGLLASMEKIGNSVRGLGRLVGEPMAEDHQTITHTNYRFDEEGFEWQSLITKNSYEVNAFMNLDMPQLQNFGTVDNPHLIFTSEVPFRFVGCAGPPSEDDFETHEVMWFLLREGPLQRCSACGQVFKLIRLRDEFNTENDYYASGLSQQLIDEFGEADVWGQFSIFRPFMFFTNEHTHFETASNYFYSLMRADDQDRYLTDPAYRLEKNKEADLKHLQIIETLESIDQAFQERFSKHNLHNEISKDQYENLIETEKSIELLNLHFKRVNRFKLRHMIDPENHLRREKRMQERRNIRENNVTIYLDNADEDHVAYYDYFETDAEIEEDNNYNQINKIELDVLSEPSNQLNRFDFNEVYTFNVEEDATGFVEKQIFKYKYRAARDSNEDYKRRETRRIEAVQKWAANSKYLDVLDKIEKVTLEMRQPETSANRQAIVKEELIMMSKQKLDMELELAIDNYESYFESDLEEESFQAKDIKLGNSAQILKNLPITEKSLLVQMAGLENLRFDPSLSLTIKAEKPMPVDALSTNSGFLGYLFENYTMGNEVERNMVDFGNQRVYVGDDKIDYKTYIAETESDNLEEDKASPALEDFNDQDSKSLNTFLEANVYLGKQTNETKQDKKD